MCQNSAFSVSINCLQGFPKSDWLLNSGRRATSKPASQCCGGKIRRTFSRNIADVGPWQVGLLENGKSKRPLEGILDVCGTVCPSVRELEPDDGWSVLTCAAQWTVRLDVAGLPPSLSLPPLSHSASLLLCFTSSGPNMSCCRCSLTLPPLDSFPLIVPSPAL